MTNPTTKAELLTLIRESHEGFWNVMSHIPAERMNEIALYDNWTIKDLIAHLGWWVKTGAERVAAMRRGRPPVRFTSYDYINEDILERFQDSSMDEVRAMEANGFQALEWQIQTAHETELFDSSYFPALEGQMLAALIIKETYDHYDKHLEDLKPWLRQNGCL